MQATKVTALPDYKIDVTFDNGVNGIVDLKAFISTGIFKTLKDQKKFKDVYITKSAIAWSEELEIDAAAIYAELVNKSAEDVLHTNMPYATD